MTAKKDTTQTIANIIDLLSRCELDDLKAIKPALDELIRDAENPDEHREYPHLTERRSNQRFPTNLLCTLFRVTDVKPGEKREFTAEILDISRHGMRLKLDANFAFSRIVKVTFASPGQMTKQCYLEVVHSHRVSDAAGQWFDVGCHGVVAEKQVKMVRGREIRIERMQSRLKARKEIKILVVGPDSSQKANLISRLKAEGFLVRRTAHLTQSFKILRNPAFDLAIFTQGPDLARDPQLLESIRYDLNDVAKLALIVKPQDGQILCDQGFDHAHIDSDSREEIAHAVEQALMNHVTSQTESKTGSLVNVTQPI